MLLTLLASTHAAGQEAGKDSTSGNVNEREWTLLHVNGHAVLDGHARLTISLGATFPIASAMDSVKVPLTSQM